MRNSLSFNNYKQLVNELESRLNPKFEVIYAKINSLEMKMDQKFETVDQKFATVDQKFETVDQKFETMNTKIDGIEKQMSQLLWLLPLIISIILALFSFVNKINI